MLVPFTSKQPPTEYYKTTFTDNSFEVRSFINNHNFVDCIFIDITLTDVTFNKCTFTRCSFKGACLYSTEFYDCTFSGCDMSHGVYVSVIFEDGTMEKMDFSNMYTMSDVEFKMIEISQSWFLHVQVDGDVVKFAQCKMEFCTFQDYLLKGFTFDKCTLWKLLFELCDIDKSSFMDSYIKDCRFTNVTFGSMIFDTTPIINTTFNLCSFSKDTKLRNITITDITLSDTVLPLEITVGVMIAPLIALGQSPAPTATTAYQPRTPQRPAKPNITSVGMNMAYRFITKGVK